MVKGGDLALYGGLATIGYLTLRNSQALQEAKDSLSGGGGFGGFDLSSILGSSGFSLPELKIDAGGLLPDLSGFKIPEFDLSFIGETLANAKEEALTIIDNARDGANEIIENAKNIPGDALNGVTDALTPDIDQTIFTPGGVTSEESGQGLLGTIGAGGLIGGVIGLALGGPVGAAVLGVLGAGTGGAGEIARRRTIAGGGDPPTLKNFGGLLPGDLTLPGPNGNIAFNPETFEITQPNKPVSSSRSGSRSRYLPKISRNKPNSTPMQTIEPSMTVAPSVVRQLEQERQQSLTNSAAAKIIAARRGGFKV